ncbi:MAG: preprotein translocase subunit SecG [Treponema sp.]|nr:preprotein translocase subunit SecG [Treponema sp.]
MGPISVVLLVAFVIICALSVLLVLVQDQDNSGMGGMLGGGNSAAFGAHSASVLTKATAVLVALFFVVVFALAFANKKSAKGHSDTLSEAAKTMNIQGDASKDASAADWWKENTESKEAPASTVENNAVESTSSDSNAVENTAAEPTAEVVAEPAVEAAATEAPVSEKSAAVVETVAPAEAAAN